MPRLLGLALSLILTLPAVAQAGPLTVVELFTSQGCSSCPPANANLAKLADRPDVLALSFGVTYWDQLGWKDTFASKAYTDRQWAYAKGLHHNQVWTPQVVVNGRTDVVGIKLAEIEGAARKAPIVAGPQLSVSDGVLTLSAAKPAKADVWLVRYDPAIVQVPVKRGENTGKTLPHRNVVREMTRLGAYTGQALTYRLPAGADPRLKTAILVQAGPGGPILAAAKT
ncbi:DUF1223 domain-containing protein [Phenylobacterium sp. 20VBR1]|uniref:DUF1223 domain-containing protein n=1 Tax=Phenylobacterium glaciei TaxID=2803784 RepID=A0A941D595_9CAUL|nr:DUF1223 domain-containing protein [Phenylobacterium glaciei]MBR7621176.1 DUF1223 domain-containing protein [Phenylobacterium glaciei]